MLWDLVWYVTCIRMYVCTKLYLVTVQEKVFVCSPMCFGKKRLYICVSLVHNILQKYTKISMHVCVIRISIHTSQRTPGVYCRRVSINKNDQQPFYTYLWEIFLLYFSMEVPSFSARRLLHSIVAQTILFPWIDIFHIWKWSYDYPTRLFFGHKYCEHRFCLFFLTHTLIKHHEIGTVTGYTQKRVLSRNF